VGPRHSITRRLERTQSTQSHNADETILFHTLFASAIDESFGDLNTERRIECNIASDITLLFTDERMANQLIVGPQPRSWKVLRETVGERFLSRSQMRVFIGSFRKAAIKSFHANDLSQSIRSKSRRFYLLFLHTLRKKSFFSF